MLYHFTVIQPNQYEIAKLTDSGLIKAMLEILSSQALM
jgi:hypothetical protein